MERKPQMDQCSCSNYLKQRHEGMTMNEQTYIAHFAKSIVGRSSRCHLRNNPNFLFLLVNSISPGTHDHWRNNIIWGTDQATFSRNSHSKVWKLQTWVQTTIMSSWIHVQLETVNTNTKSSSNSTALWFQPCNSISSTNFSILSEFVISPQWRIPKFLVTESIRSWL